MDYFSTSYSEARERFVQATKRYGVIPVRYLNSEAPDPEKVELTTDVAVFGENSAQNVLIISSATHGVEGYAGSACQLHMIHNKFYGLFANPGVKIVLIHALNPYGFAYDRRVTEGNVDLNRNFIDFSITSGSNDKQYGSLASVLVPESQDTAVLSDSEFKIAQYIQKKGQENFQHIVMKGQYSFPDGLFYGGCRPVWSRNILEKIIQVHTNHASRIVYLDLHTGLGPFGYGEILYPWSLDRPAYKALNDLFGQELRCPLAATSAAMTVSGCVADAFTGYGAEKVIPLALEFGTVPLMDMINALRHDATFHSGQEYSDTRQQRLCRHLMRAAFLSDDPQWRQDILVRGREVISNLGNLFE